MPLIVLLLLAFLIILPFAELAVIIGVAIWIGVLPMLGLLALSSIIGLLIVRYRTGTHWLQFREAVGNLKLPTTQAFNGVAVPVGGALLVIPGFITSLMGLFLLAPPTRFVARKMVFMLITSQFMVLKFVNRLPGPIKRPVLWVLRNNFLVRWLNRVMAWGGEEWKQRQSGKSGGATGRPVDPGRTQEQIGTSSEPTPTEPTSEPVPTLAEGVGQSAEATETDRPV